MLASHCANRATAVKTASFFITVEQHCPSNVNITFRKDFQCVQHRDEVDRLLAIARSDTH
jgi:hypothetical protein